MRSGEIIVLLVAQPVVGKPRIKLFRACGPAERVSGGTGLCVRGWEGACPWLVGWSCALVSVCVLSCLRSCVRFVACSRVSCPGLRFLLAVMLIFGRGHGFRCLKTASVGRRQGRFISPTPFVNEAIDDRHRSEILGAPAFRICDRRRLIRRGWQSRPWRLRSAAPSSKRSRYLYVPHTRISILIHLAAISSAAGE